MSEYPWCIPNTVEVGHRGDDTTDGWGSIEYSTELARASEQHGWGGALFGTGWGRPDTFTVATAVAARTTTFKPLIAVRPGYWQPAHFASAAATLDQLTQDRHPTLYFGGASEAAERVSAVEADVQLFWGESLEGLAERIDRLRTLTDKVGRRGEVLDSCLYTTPGKVGGGGAATTWLVGSADDVAAALQKYRELGISHFVLSDTPYRSEVVRLGDQLLPRLRELEHQEALP
jgi:alkanesulfonate monooxygenase SsuD/methylene tetrahydromethanopterin reductase-like flavin-dependent oxidoreductase (luciferase family)